jgi:UDP-glucose 4-epimerase
MDGGMSEAKTAVITGGGGFVIANVVRLWLERDASARAIVIDASPLDVAAKRHFAPFADRLQFVIGDVGKVETWAGLPTDATCRRRRHAMRIWRRRGRRAIRAQTRGG